jgi:Zn-dependent peptidase ImmA (M78 family)
VIDLWTSDRIDAVACWGPRHGPAVLLNREGRHAHTERGARATLAHEICHLLIDRQGSLPLAGQWLGLIDAGLMGEYLPGSAG